MRAGAADSHGVRFGELVASSGCPQLSPTPTIPISGG